MDKHEMGAGSREMSEGIHRALPLPPRGLSKQSHAFEHTRCSAAGLTPPSQVSHPHRHKLSLQLQLANCRINSENSGLRLIESVFLKGKEL